MPPTEHRLHRTSHRDDALFDVGGDCNAGRAGSGSVKPHLTIAGYPSRRVTAPPAPRSRARSARACAFVPPCDWQDGARGLTPFPPPSHPPGRQGACAVRAHMRGERGVVARAGGGGAGGSVTGALRASPAAAPSASSASPPPQLALLVMQPCGGEEAAAGAAGAVLPLPGADPPLPPSGSGGLMLFYELGGDGEAEVGEEAEAAGGESTASPEELEEEEATTTAAAAASSGETAAAAGGGCKSCTYEGCSETTTQVVKQRKPWMCKRHRNKIYKDKYKRKKSDQALGGGGAAAAGAGPRAEDSVEGSVSVTKQRTGSIGDRPARPTLLEQVLNKKRLSLLRSPEVVQFLQKQQQLLSQQALEQRQQQFQGAPG
ncbi:unnamed protein product [Bubo scandiacus]